MKSALDFLIHVGDVPMLTVESEPRAPQFQEGYRQAKNYSTNFRPREQNAAIREMTVPFLLVAAGNRAEMRRAVIRGLNIDYEPVLLNGQPAFLKWEELKVEAKRLRLSKSTFSWNLLDRGFGAVTLFFTSTRCHGVEYSKCRSLYYKLPPPPPQFTKTGFYVLRIVLGVLLLAASGLKIHGLALDPLSQDSFLSSPRLQIATIEVEILLGMWLLSGWSVRAAWVAALVFFGILAGVNLYLILVGQRSCGCFGRVTVSPWLTFGLDVAVVAALALWRPAHTADTQPAAWLQGLLKTAAGAAVLLVLIGGAFLLAFDNPIDALARLRGESITVEPAVTDVGGGVAGEQRTFTIQLRNHTDRPVRIVGGTTSCSCMATGDLPITVPPGESRPIEVRMTFGGSAGRFQHRFVLYTDDEKQGVVVARFAGRVVEPPSP